MEEEKVTPSYFQLIYDQLTTIEQQAPWADQVLDQIQLRKMDVRFLKTFCLCLETWDDTTDEESMFRLRSITTTFRVIWPKEHKGLSLLKRLAETWPIDIEDFHSANIELESRIQQSKLQFEGWCENLMHSSMQCKSPTFYDIWDSLQHLQKNLDDYSSYRVVEIVPYEKQIDFLKGKIVFLDELVDNVERCPYTKEILQFLSFVRAFANNAACITCLYWAKESNEEIATEMYVVLFDMLQKFIPYASDITPLYIGILKSYDLQPSDCFRHGEPVESFVEFFFRHLAICLKYDFLILRDKLIFLITFLTDPPCEKAEQEESIRSQIYALFREDAYLLLPFEGIKTDFTKKMLLTDCMTKIDMANAKIRQFYCGFSGSWIRLEVEKMDYTYFVSVQRELSSIEKHAEWANSVLGQLQLYRIELRFLRAFLLCFATWDDTDEEIMIRLRSMITSLQGIWEKEENGLLAPRLHAICMRGITDWHPLASELELKIQQSKIEIKAWWVNLFLWSFQCKPSTSYNILKCLDSIIQNLNDLVIHKTGETVSFKKQIETLEEKVVFIKNFLKLTANCIHSKDLGEFCMFVQVFANDAACLTFLYWAKDASDEIASETNSMLSHMLQKIKPTKPNVARLYFEALKAIYMQQSDSLVFGQTALRFVDLFLEDPVTHLKDDFRILEDDMIFLLTFLNDPLNENAKEVIYSQIDVLFWEGVYCLLPFDDMEGEFSEKKVLLSDFMRKIEAVNASIRQNFCKFPESSVYNFPKVISPRFLDFLIENLGNLKEKMFGDWKYVSFAKYKIINIEEELISLCPFFNHIFDLQNELSETWLEVVDLVHLTEHVISSCISSLFIIDRPIWYHMAYLSTVFDRIKVVKTKLEKIKEDTKYNVGCLPHSAGIISKPLEQARPSNINEIVVGFEDEVEKIIGELIWGHMSLDIVSIVGMGGLGKTTLAKKVYGSSLVKCNFDVCAFNSVSQDHNTRRLLHDILSDMKGVDNTISDMSEDDLAHLLWKSLSRQKYLIVIDDIWKVSTWNKIKSSFPDDKNGSRVMFTTRSRDVADKCKINCVPHQLRFLSEVESWELLQKKVFHDAISPPYLYEIGKIIAKNCKGLPLAVVVIAGLLARTEKTVMWWSEVEERLASYLSDEGCMNILELSYKHLPKHLIPCLLYLGAFPKGSLITVKQVLLLWIAEGFVQESETKRVEDVAKEHFNDLVDRRFIIISARNSTGEIKTFRVHDLINDLCQTKCRDGTFFQLNHGITSSNSSDLSINTHYRVSTQFRSDVNIATESSLSNARSVLFFTKKLDDIVSRSPLKEFRLAQVLEFDLLWTEFNLEQLSSFVHLRHLNAHLLLYDSKSIPSSIYNLWNIVSLMLTSSVDMSNIHLPESFWTMKSLRHVKVDKCILEFPDGHEEHDACTKLDKVVSFSNPILSTGKDVERLLQRLPAIQKLSCTLAKFLDNDKESVETVDFHTKLESLKLTQFWWKKSPYSINFPSTLKKLTLWHFQLPWTAISAIAELQCLQVLKLKSISFPDPILDIEDMTFQNLKFFELHEQNLVEWIASIESLPCLEQIVIKCPSLKGLPPCFEESSTLKRIIVRESLEVESSALQIREELMGLGNEVEVLI